MSGTSVETAVHEFLLACQADGLASTTIRWYESRLRIFAAAVAGLSVEQVTASLMRAYVVTLRERTVRYVDAPQRPQLAGGLSPDTVHGHLRALRRFFAWCTAEYTWDAARNPMLRIRLPSLQQQPKAITLQDLSQLLRATDNTPAGVRDRAILIFLADTGCRAGGLLTLKPPELDLEMRRAVVVEKGSRVRAVPFTPYTAELLRCWLRLRPLHAQSVFCSLHPKSYGEPLTLSGLHGLLRRLKRRAGVRGRVNPHSFRHAYAREYLTNGGDLASLARLLGHSDVSVTANYYAVFTEGELAQKHAQFSPIRNLIVDV